MPPKAAPKIHDLFRLIGITDGEIDAHGWRGYLNGEGWEEQKFKRLDHREDGQFFQMWANTYFKDHPYPPQPMLGYQIFYSQAQAEEYDREHLKYLKGVQAKRRADEARARQRRVRADAAAAQGERVYADTVDEGRRDAEAQTAAALAAVSPVLGDDSSPILFGPGGSGQGSNSANDVDTQNPSNATNDNNLARELSPEAEVVVPQVEAPSAANEGLQRDSSPEAEVVVAPVRSPDANNEGHPPRDSSSELENLISQAGAPSVTGELPIASSPRPEVSAPLMRPPTGPSRSRIEVRIPLARAPPVPSSRRSAPATPQARAPPVSSRRRLEAAAPPIRAPINLTREEIIAQNLEMNEDEVDNDDGRDTTSVEYSTDDFSPSLPRRYASPVTDEADECSDDDERYDYALPIENG